MNNGSADVIVVGLGAMGSSTAYQLALRGVSVIGIDRFAPPHDQGSSHGDSRVTRQATAEGAAYVPFAVRSQELWRLIEHETATDIFTDCGVLMIAPEGGGGAALHGTPDWLGRTISLAREFGIEHELLAGAEVQRRYPAFQLDDTFAAYLEPGGGFVRPERAVAAQLALAQRHGATVHDSTTVTNIAASGDSVVVTTDRGTFTAAHAVLSAGAWLPTLLDDPALRSHFSVSRQELHWFAPAADRARHVAPGACPVFFWTFGDGPRDFFYGFPAVDGVAAGMKVATEQFEHTTTADTAQRAASAAEAAAMYDHCIRGRVAALTPQHLQSVACLYTSTPTADFVVAAHPTLLNVTLVSPCSGHGFKHSAAIGEAVAETVVDGASRLDLSPFGLSGPRQPAGGDA